MAFRRVTEVSYFALRSITPECFPSLSPLDAVLLFIFAMTAAAFQFPPSLQSVTGVQGPGDIQSNPATDTLVQQQLEHAIPPPLDTVMTPPDDPLAPDLTAFNITIPKCPNSASCFTCGDRIAAREARARKGAKRARVMHLRCCGLTPPGSRHFR